jgi:hypothetical protein
MARYCSEMRQKEKAEGRTEKVKNQKSKVKNENTKSEVVPSKLARSCPA